MNTPRIYIPETLATIQARVMIPATGGQIKERWALHRPIGWGGLMLWHRLRCAWLVFTAKADVLTWDGQP